MLKKYWHVLAFVIAIVIGLYLRVINPWNSVFTWTVRLGGNDPWYYERLIENCIHNFPYRIWFDPFTKYPYGTYTHFGPFLVYLSSIAAILYGAKTPEAIRAISAFIPVIGGIAIVFPVYLLTKEVFGKRAAVIATVLMVIIPGQFLQRSMLGFNDHHVWEAFWIITALALYVFSLNRWIKETNIKRNLIFATLTGLAFGLYLDTWAPGFVFGLIITTFIYLSLLLGLRVEKRVFLLTAYSFVVASLIYLPFINTPYISTTHYTPLQLEILLTLSAVILLLWLVDENYEKIAKFVRISKQSFFAVLALFALIALPNVFPTFYSALMSVIGVVRPRGGALTIAEVYPFFFTHAGEFTLSNAIFNFGTAFFFAIPAIAYSAYRIYRNRNLAEFAVFVWAIVMFIALCGQNRFAYYFASVTAIYCAFALDSLFSKLQLYDFIENIVKKRKGFSYTRVVIALLIALAVFYPTFALADMESKSGGGPNRQWYDALVWLRNNTPDGELYDKYYYELYKPPKNTSRPYDYPFKTYGVISWWDYGHWIETIGHRMPIANPFQQGIGGRHSKTPGASWFFTAFNESEAEITAKALNVRFVVSDLEMATGKFYAIATWSEGDLPYAEKYYAGFSYVANNMLGFAMNRWELPPNAVIIMRNPSILYYMTMEAKFHMLDGVGLSHYRLIYESKPDYGWLDIVRQLKEKGLNISESDVISIAAQNAYYRALYGVSPSIWAQEVLIKYVYKKLYESKIGIPLSTLMPTGYVKIFERVKGAKITGRVPEGVDEVRLNVTIKTNQNRTFEYVLVSDVKNGTYEFVVPYSQDTSYDVKPITPYFIRAGNIVKTVNVTEDEVLNGGIVRVDFD